MALQSQLFRGDLALEAAATVDSAHITPGARGPHVEKIQTALNILDNAGLNVDGAYGPATANAVLNYKKKRNVINYSYQTSPDNIVGKMTMAKLDEEMQAHETKPSARIQLIPISPRANRDKAYSRIAFQTSKSKTLVATSATHILPTQSITIDIGQQAEVEVKNGDGYELMMHDPQLNVWKYAALLVVPGENTPRPYQKIESDSVVIKVRGMRWGTVILVASKLDFWGSGPEEQLVINVRDPRPDNYHPTPAHHHEPVKEPDEWNKVCEEAAKDPDLGWTLTVMARNKVGPRTVVEAARVTLVPYTNAGWHFDYYLMGKGGVMNEDALLKWWIEDDDNARKVIAKRIREKRWGTESPVSVMFTFEQGFYGNNDARQCFGAIDNLEVKADFVNGTVEIWFEDTYEWHPPYSQYTKPQRCPDIGTPGAKRDTNFGHAALVQMKTRGAKDFQMRGKASFPMKLFPGL
jgi:hypothetical protein